MSGLLYPIAPILDEIVTRETGWFIDHVDDLRTKRWVHPDGFGVIVELLSGWATFWPPGCEMHTLSENDGRVRVGSLIEAIAVARGRVS